MCKTSNHEVVTRSLPLFLSPFLTLSSRQYPSSYSNPLRRNAEPFGILTLVRNPGTNYYTMASPSSPQLLTTRSTNLPLTLSSPLPFDYRSRAAIRFSPPAIKAGTKGSYARLERTCERCGEEIWEWEMGAVRRTGRERASRVGVGTGRGGMVEVGACAG